MKSCKMRVIIFPRRSPDTPRMASTCRTGPVSPGRKLPGLTIYLECHTSTRQQNESWWKVSAMIIACPILLWFSISEVRIAVLIAKAVIRDRAISSSFCSAICSLLILPILPKLAAIMSQGSPRLAVSFPQMSSTIMSMFLRFPDSMAMKKRSWIDFLGNLNLRMLKMVFSPTMDPPTRSSLFSSILWIDVPFLSMTRSAWSGMVWQNCFVKLLKWKWSSVSLKREEKWKKDSFCLRQLRDQTALSIRSLCWSSNPRMRMAQRACSSFLFALIMFMVWRLVLMWNLSPCRMLRKCLRILEIFWEVGQSRNWSREHWNRKMTALFQLKIFLRYILLRF